MSTRYEARTLPDGRVIWRRQRWPESDDVHLLLGWVLAVVYAAWTRPRLSSAITTAVIVIVALSITWAVRRRWSRPATLDEALRAMRADEDGPR